MTKRSTRKFARATADFYPEPGWCSRRLFEAEDFGARGALVLDPCCGLGRVSRAAANAGFRAVASDVFDRRNDRLSELAGIEFHICNFLEFAPVSRPWAIACNPPFDLIREFCERSIELATYKVAMLAPLRRLPAAGWLQRLPLESVLLLTPRPSLLPGSCIEAGEKPCGGREDFVAWLIFTKRSSPIAPRLRWLHRDGAGPSSLSIENAVTADDPNGPRPPIGDGWRLVRRKPRATSWRRIGLAG